MADSETILALARWHVQCTGPRTEAARPQLLDPNAPLMASEALLGGPGTPRRFEFHPKSVRFGLCLLWTGIGADGFIVQQIEPRPVWSKRLGPIGWL